MRAAVRSARQTYVHIFHRVYRVRKRDVDQEAVNTANLHTRK